MSTRELEQALAASKWKGAEETIGEVIAKMLELPIETVQRVVFAWESVRDKKLRNDAGDQLEDIFDGLVHGDHILDDVKHAMVQHLHRGFHRASVRWRMERGQMLEVAFKKLVPKNKPAGMCMGCPWQLECVRDMLSTPERCWDGKHTYCKEQYDGKASRVFQHITASVRPLKLEGNIVTVEADHPRGVFMVNVMDVRV